MKNKILFESYFKDANKFTDDFDDEETIAGSEDERLLSDFKNQTFWYCCSYDSSFALNTSKDDVRDKLNFLRKMISILEMNRCINSITEPFIMECYINKDNADDSEIVISGETLFTFPIVRLIKRCGTNIENICFVFGFTLDRKPNIRHIVKMINHMASITDEKYPLGDCSYAIVTKHYGKHIIMENIDMTSVEKLRELVVRCKYMLEFGTEESITYPEIIAGMRLSDAELIGLFHAKYDNIFYCPNLDCGIFRVKSLPVEEYKTLIENFVSQDKALIKYNIPYMNIRDIDADFLDDPAGYHPYMDEFCIVFGVDEEFSSRNCMYICFNERPEDSVNPAHIKMIFHMGDGHCEKSQYDAAAKFLYACGITATDVEAARKQFVAQSGGNKQKMLTILKKELQMLKKS